MVVVLIAYRLLTGDDNSEFCHKVSEALDKGWVLYGNPSYAYNAETARMRCAQAVTKTVEGSYSADMKLGQL